MAESAHEPAAFVDRVRRATGAAEVDLVGHSRGGVMPRHYLRFLGGADAVGLSPSDHGTTIDGLALLPGVAALLTASAGPAVRDQVACRTTAVPGDAAAQRRLTARW